MTFVTSVKEQGSTIFTALRLILISFTDVIGKIDSTVIAALVSVMVWSLCQDSLNMLKLLPQLHPGVALLCAISAFIARRVR